MFNVNFGSVRSKSSAIIGPHKDRNLLFLELLTFQAELTGIKAKNHEHLPSVDIIISNLLVLKMLLLNIVTKVIYFR